MSARPINDLLREHRSGLTHDEISDLLQQIVAAVAEEKKAGEMTVTFVVKPYGKDGAVEVSIAAKVKMPKKTPGSSIFYISPENNLIREDPRQPRLELREAPPASAARALA